jgi:hypothetical protein
VLVSTGFGVYHCGTREIRDFRNRDKLSQWLLDRLAYRCVQPGNLQ